MTPTMKDTEFALDGQAALDTFQSFVKEQIRTAMRTTFIDILQEEVTAFIGAQRYERSDERRDHRAGHRSRSLGTSAGVIDDLPVTQRVPPHPQGLPDPAV